MSRTSHNNIPGIKHLPTLRLNILTIQPTGILLRIYYYYSICHLTVCSACSNTVYTHRRVIVGRDQENFLSFPVTLYPRRQEIFQKIPFIFSYFCQVTKKMILKTTPFSHERSSINIQKTSSCHFVTEPGRRQFRVTVSPS